MGKKKPTIADYWCEQYERFHRTQDLGFCRRDAVILNQLLKQYGNRHELAWAIRQFHRNGADGDAFVEREGFSARAFAARMRSLHLKWVKSRLSANLEAVAQDGRVISLVERIGRPI